MHSSIIPILFAAGALAGPIMSPPRYGAVHANANVQEDDDTPTSTTYAVVETPTTTTTPSTYSTTTTTCSDGALPTATTDADSIDALLPPIVPLNPRGGDPELIAQLVTAVTAGDRLRLLNQPGDHVFDFNNPPDVGGAESDGLAGRTVAANGKTFPALIGLGSSMAIGFLGPCGLNTPHVHNRATELNVVVKGRLVTNFQGENNVDPVENTLTLYQMAAFPQGAIHQEFNPDCEDTVFVAAFNNIDPGVEQVAQTFFNLRPDAIAATLNGVSYIDGKDIETFRPLIPANVAQGIDACLNRCGITRNAKRDLSEVLMA